MKKRLTSLWLFLLFSSFSYSASVHIDERASYLAGLGVPDTSILYQRTQTSYYRNYRNQMNAGWENINRVSLQHIPVWRKNELKESFSNVFYPFGGPDLMNALVFFPEAENYILIGLEAPGNIPDPVALSRKSDSVGLNLVRSSMNEILGHNFFHTKRMAKKIARHSYNGILGIMIIMAKKSGYFIEDVKLFSAHYKKNWKGFKITMSKNNKKQKVIYLQANVNDHYFADNQFLQNVLHKYPADITMLKAASYLMFLPSFDDIRSYVLSRSPVIMQDASGIPFHYFNAGWDNRLYGTYQKPIPLFHKRCQPDLKKSVSQSSRGRISFYYGYLSPRYNQTFIMVSRRKGALTSPVYDRSSKKGMNTWCYKGKLIKKQY